MQPARATRTVAVFALLASVALGSGRAAWAQSAGGAPEAKRTLVPPKLLHFVEAEFPASEQASGRGATVVLQISITESGSVAEVKAIGSAGASFDAAAVAAAKQFIFSPATADGKPIPVKITYQYVFTFTEKLVKRTTADFGGTVRDRATKQPLANVRVALDTGQMSMTGDHGEFSIPEVVPGEHAVTLSGERLVTVGTTETFEASKRIDATYEVEPKKESKGGDEDEEEIVVTAPRLKKQVVSTEVQAAQATRVPGTQGDVLKVVENLPGVARSAAGSGTLVVWGSAPQDTRVYVTGVHVPRLYHDGGYRSIVNSDFVQSVELVPGGYGSSYGRGLGGLVTVAYRPLDDEGIHGSVAADTIDVSAAARGKVGDRVHVAVAARKSWLDSVVSAVTTENVGQYVPIPRYWDGQARAVVDLGPHETIEVGTILSSDQTTRNLTNPDPSLSTSQTSGLDFQRVYLRYERHLPDSSIIDVVPSWGLNSSSLANRYGSTLTTVDNDSNILGFRAGWRGPATQFLRLSAGLDGELLVSSLHRSGSLGFPPREGDIYVFGQAPPSQVSSDAWKTVVGSVGAYVEGDASFFGDSLHVVPGVRFEPYFTGTNRIMPPLPGNPNVSYSREEPVIEPRISLRYAFTPRISMKAAYGVYHQAPQPEDMSSQFGTPTLDLSTAEHWLVGGSFQLTELLSAEVTGFISSSSDLVVRSQSDSPFVAQALDQNGVGRSYGTQFLFRQQKVGPFFGWVSYSILRSERRDAPGLDWRLFDYDQSHVFTALGSYDLGSGFEFGMRFRYSTGYPRTPVIGSYYDSKAGAIEPIFGAHNSIRIPFFMSLDARLSKRFKIGRSEGEVYLDVQNVTNHSNPEEIVYDTRYTQKAYITGFPIMPVIGARWSW